MSDSKEPPVLKTVHDIATGRLLARFYAYDYYERVVRSLVSTEPRPRSISQQSVREALHRVLVHIEDNQICGVWPDGSKARGSHIKHLFEELLEEVPPSHEQTMEALAFAHGAIVDAIGCEDGLDGQAGAAVLKMIRAALTANGRTPPDMPLEPLDVTRTEGGKVRLSREEFDKIAAGQFLITDDENVWRAS
jgi:hypothetical protein